MMPKTNRQKPSKDNAVTHLIAGLRFKHLRLLQALVEGGSLRSAATTMNLTQPALSRMLSDIETSFGAQLFERSSRGLTPTPKGLAAIRGAGQLLEDLSRVQQEVALGFEAATVLRIGAPHFVAHGYLPAVVAALRKSQPRVHLQLREGAVLELFDALAAGEVDALVSTYAARSSDETTVPLVYEQLFDSQYVVIGPTSGPLAGIRTRVALASLAAEPWILPTRSSMLRTAVDLAFQHAGLTPPIAAVESNHPVTNLEFVAMGLGLSLVPLHAMKAYASTRRVRRLYVEPSILTGPVALVYRAGDESSRVGFLRAALKGRG
jgi:LysR family transcriptional regulator, regulator of abg operon